MTDKIVNQNLILERIRKIFEFDSETGIFTHKKGRRKGAPAGNVAANGYIYIWVSGNLFLAHRLVWLRVTGSFPRGALDHIDGSKTFNAFANLREATILDNSGNRGPNKNNRSGFKGVIPYGERFTAQICIHGKRTHLGIFPNGPEAAKAYDAAALLHFGQFAKTNQMMGLI